MKEWRLQKRRLASLFATVISLWYVGIQHDVTRYIWTTLWRPLKNHKNMAQKHNIVVLTKEMFTEYKTTIWSVGFLKRNIFFHLRPSGQIMQYLQILSAFLTQNFWPISGESLENHCPLIHARLLSVWHVLLRDSIYEKDFSSTDIWRKKLALRSSFILLFYTSNLPPFSGGEVFFNCSRSHMTGRCEEKFLDHRATRLLWKKFHGDVEEQDIKRQDLSFLSSLPPTAHSWVPFSLCKQSASLRRYDTQQQVRDLGCSSSIGCFSLRRGGSPLAGV